jgi:hypothetical protein
MQVLEKSGERGRNRTYNLLIKSQLLCQLSYAPLLTQGENETELYHPRLLEPDSVQSSSPTIFRKRFVEHRGNTKSVVWTVVGMDGLWRRRFARTGHRPRSYMRPTNSLPLC